MKYARFPLQLLTVGKPKSSMKYVDVGIDDYSQRLIPYVDLSFKTIPDETLSDTKLEAYVLSREEERILKSWEKASYRVLLSERGKRYTSPAFSEELFVRNPFTNPSNGCVRIHGSGPIIVVIGGSLGVSEKVMHQADWVVSLSDLTFPHPLVPLLFLEQLYRACRIYYNEPYHK